MLIILTLSKGDWCLFFSHGKVILDLEEEKQRHAQDTAEGDDVTYMLEKERERLTQQVCLLASLPSEESDWWLLNIENIPGVGEEVGGEPQLCAWSLLFPASRELDPLSGIYVHSVTEI